MPDKGMRNVLFLYSEIMPYNLACFRKLYQEFSVQVHVIRWDTKLLTPYTPEEEEGLHFYKRSEYDLNPMKQMVDVLNPGIIYIVGRMDADYLSVARYAKSKNIVTVSGWDNQWRGSLRNRVASVGARWLYKRYFDFIMIPGVEQYEYVRRLGYSKNRILFNLLSCDVDLFTTAYKVRSANAFSVDKIILYLGRLAEVKGILLLTKVFTALQQEGYEDWKLMLIGNGPLAESVKQIPGTEVVQFSDQQEIVDRLNNISFFCLPSFNEPWGVVIHEMAAAGIPMVTSDVCGASTVFLKNGYNGYSFENGNEKDLKDKLIRMMNLSAAENASMSNRSYELSRQINPLIWAHSFMSAVK